MKPPQNLARIGTVTGMLLSACHAHTPATPAGTSQQAAAASAAATGSPATAGKAEVPVPVAATVSAAAAASAPLPCKAAFCENFETPTEQGLLDPARWERPQGNAIVTRGRANTGTGAMHIPAFTGKGYHFFRTRKPFPALEKAHFGRVFLWIEQAPTTSPAKGSTWHFDVQKTGGKLSDGSDADIGFGGVVSHGLVREFYSNTFPYTWSHTGTEVADMPTKVWTCLEWQYDSEQGLVRYWSNGVALTSMSVDGVKTLPRFTRVSPGWYEYHPTTTPWEIYLDDFAIDGNRIGCGKP